MATASAGYVLFDNFATEILQYVPGAPTILIRTHIRNAIIEFLERSMILKKDPSSFYLEEDEHTYTLKYSGDRYRAVAIKGDSTRLGEEENDNKMITTATEHEMDASKKKWRTTTGLYPTVCWLTPETNKIRFYPIPNQDSDEEVFMTTAVTLKRDQTEIDEWIYEKWEETIQAGALASLLIIAGASWYNAQLSRTFSYVNKRGIKRARAIALRGTGEFSGRVTPQNFEVMGSDRTGTRSATWE